MALGAFVPARGVLLLVNFSFWEVSHGLKGSHFENFMCKGVSRRCGNAYKIGSFKVRGVYPRT